ncbi:NADP-dependent oxidoreductase [Anianabacter salinae]|uniref:NADP-dependent oxidoreductase n=1 Tax=Anianabacter salinae TaxID=2851023 RepID=UPI00225E5EDA|nr:NADP-dependent oxidoreductase [Anianabacter salinae]MBV0913641.1 NADP-dependent oxidoreductase [Anianabacter salinae]
MTTAHRIVLASRPKGAPTADNFRHESFDLPAPGAGEVALRTVWLSLDPYMRGRMNDGPSYAAATGIGEVMTGEVVAEVTESHDDAFKPGDLVQARIGWASHGVSAGADLRKLPTDNPAPLQSYLGILGMPGLTAFVGVNDLLEVQSGQTVVISAATGAVGTMAGQLAKAKGARVIGVAGGPEKCDFAVKELGFDLCLDHRSPALRDEMAMAAPDGIDRYFENVGGSTLSAVIGNMAEFGRIAVCGMVAWYNGKNTDTAPPLPVVWRNVLTKRLRVEGFLIFDRYDRLDAFLSEVGPMVADGTIKYRETVMDGLDNAPDAFLSMLEGGNFGKQLVRVGDDP